ncbi:MAG: glycoside hydrolase family 2 protein [Bacteroidales bacterium]|nr:glycoside hydrolase family 2 protein [Bacteroidales bacterium]
MNRLIVSLCSALLFTACATDDNYTTEVLFDNGWHFVRIDDTLSESDSLSYISGVIPVEADTVVLPHTPRIEPLFVNDQWQGTCFYFKRFQVSKEDISLRLSLRFDGAMNAADIWINGKHASSHLGGYLPFEVPLNEYINEGENVIVVCLDNRDNTTTGPTPLAILDFNTYGGLYRHVWLLKNDRLMLTRSTEGYSDAGVVFRTLNINDDFANVFVQTDVRNISSSDRNMLLDIDFIDEDGVIVSQCQIDTIIPAGQRATLARVVEIDDVQLWSPQWPNLYTLKISVREGEELLDVYCKKVGIRTLSLLDDKLYVNGKSLFLRGCNRHQEYPYIGYALSDRAQWRDAWNIKRAGFDFVRCSHYPPSEAFLEACDAYGIMVLDAILGWQYFGDKSFEAHALQSAKDLIRRDRNHPSILAWELSVDGAYMPKSFINAIAPIRDREAPSTYTAGSSKYGYDIFLESDIYNVADTLKPHIVSKYGDIIRQPRESEHDLLLNQVDAVSDLHESIMMDSKAFADAYYTMYDYNRGYAIDHEYSGVSDIFRLPKYIYYHFATFRAAEGEKFSYPFTHVVHDNGTNARVFTNSNSVSDISLFPVDSIASVKVYPLEDGPIMPSLQEFKDILIYHAELTDSLGHHVPNSNSMVQWNVSGSAYIVSPDLGLVQTVTESTMGGISSVVIEKYGDFTIKAECVDNEQVSDY